MSLDDTKKKKKYQQILKNCSGEAQHLSGLTSKAEINPRTAGPQQLLNRLSEQSLFFLLLRISWPFCFGNFSHPFFCFFLPFSSNSVSDSFLAFYCVYHVNSYLLMCHCFYGTSYFLVCKAIDVWNILNQRDALITEMKTWDMICPECCHNMFQRLLFCFVFCFLGGEFTQTTENLFTFSIVLRCRFNLFVNQFPISPEVLLTA